MNDSFRTDVFVRHPPETIACACIFLAARKLEVSVAKLPLKFCIDLATLASWCCGPWLISSQVAVFDSGSVGVADPVAKQPTMVCCIPRGRE